MGRDHYGGGGGAAHSCSSSIDSSNNPPFLSSSVASSSSSSSPAPVSNHNRRDMSTDLKLGLSISPTPNHSNDVDVSSTISTQREVVQRSLDWKGTPIKPLLRNTLADHDASLFVKVYMEGIPIGRKLDLLAHDGYNALITTLRHMFRTTILCPAADHSSVRNPEKLHHAHVLTYQDKEGDWMMVGDVPWEMFLTAVKRLKIARADRCYC